MTPCRYVITWLTVEAGQYLSGLNYHGNGDFLSPQERERLAGMRFSRRISGWLLGRRAAKTLLRRACPDLAHIPETAITIANNPAGAPYIQVDGQDPYPGCLSITHRRNLALAAYCSTPGWGIGIDLEVIEEREDSFLLDYFTPGEIATARTCQGEGARSLWITLAWSAKESALKALGTGLRLDTRSIEVAPAPGLSVCSSPDLQWGALTLRSDQFPDGSGCAWWQQRGDCVLTVAAISADGEVLDPDEICLVEIDK